MKRLMLVLSLLAMTITAAAQANRPYKCTNAASVGRYGYSCTGVAANPFDGFKVEPFSAYGVVSSDGKGQWNGYGKVSFNGVIAPWTHNTRKDAPSKVNPDCTGSVTYEVTVGGYPVPDSHFEFVIVNGAQEIKGFPVDTGYAVSCQLIKLNPVD